MLTIHVQAKMYPQIKHTTTRFSSRQDSRSSRHVPQKRNWKKIYKRSNTDDQTIQTQTFSVWKCPETPHRVNEPTHIQATVIDNQQQFLYIHSTGVTALCTLSSPFNRKSSRQLTDSFCYLLDWSVSLHSYGWLFLVGLTLHYIFHSSMHRTHWWCYWLLTLSLLSFV